MEFIKKLKPADYISLSALFFAWLSIVAILQSMPNLAILLMLTAFVFDLFDGYVARKAGGASMLGRQLDSLVDVLTYLIFSALFYYEFLSINNIMDIIVGYGIISLGILRLLRFNQEGLINEGNKKYYKGLPVFIINLLIVICYFLANLTTFWEPLFSFVVLLIASILMLGNFKVYKPKYNLMIAFLLLIIIIFTAFIAYGN
jgi:CDP-diacylglycerol---serine O-phosphatidyltransferase